MLSTITVGSHVSIQGTFVRNLAGGRVLVRVGERYYAGTPVANEAKAA